MLDIVNRRLSIACRIGILSILFAVPAMVATELFVAQSWKEIRFARNESAGTQFIQIAWPLLTADSQQPIPPELQEAAVAFGVRSAITDFAQAVSRDDRLHAGAALIIALADGSQLTLDPDLDSFYAQDAATVRLPALLTALDGLRHVAAKLDTHHETGTIALNRLSEAAEAASTSLTAAIKGNAPGLTRQALSVRLAELNAAVNGLMTEARLKQGESENRLEFALPALQTEIDQTWRATADELSRLLQVRLEGLLLKLWIGLALCAGTLVVAAALAATIAVGLSRRITSQVAAMERLAANDTAAHIPYADDRNETGRIAAALMVFRDGLIERNRLQADAARQSARFQAALDNMTQGLCLFDTERRLVVHNRRYADMFGLSNPAAGPAGLLPGLDVAGTFVAADATQRGESTHKLPDDRVIQVSQEAIAGQGWVATYEDVTERRRSQQQLWHMARHDALTGLPNRVMFREHLDGVLAGTAHDPCVALLYLDLDGFKAVNDTLGHPVGDELLQAVARRLRENTREDDMVARLGGDEFAITQADARQLGEVELTSQRLVAALRMPFEIQGRWIEIGASIGVVLADGKSSSPDELLRNADIALYRAKAEGRGTWRFFHREMDQEIQCRRQMESDLRRAVADEQFEVHYQPLIDAHTRVLKGFEALMRWRHPERGMVPPADFIPLAEEIGLIKVMGLWILNRACADAARWPEHIKVAVNLSPIQFVGGHLAHEVEMALAASGLGASRLELEITESVLLQQNNTTLGVLHRLRDMGVRISMDDFGTGYSSLSYLRRFPFHKIKIDQSFIRNLSVEDGSVEIVRAVVSLGKALGMEVLAEGVETTRQLDILQVEGCDELQGYLFSKPRPLAEVPSIISSSYL